MPASVHLPPVHSRAATAPASRWTDVSLQHRAGTLKAFIVLLAYFTGAASGRLCCRCMVDSSLAAVAGMGGRLRQLALVGLQHVSDSCLMAALEQLILLQVVDAQ